METTIITRENEVSCQQQLREFHALRHDIFVKGLGRSDLPTMNKFEFDYWDTALVSPVRFLLKDNEVPIGVARMVSSLETTMFEAKYPDYLFHPHPKRADLWEIQRLGIRLDLPKEKLEPAILKLLIDIVEWSLAHDIKSVMLMTVVGIAKKRLTEMTPIGPEKVYHGAPHVALAGVLSKEIQNQWRSKLKNIENQREQIEAA